MRFFTICCLAVLFYSCSTLHSYSFDFPTPLAPNSTIRLVQEGGPRDLATRLTVALRNNGLDVIGNNLIVRQHNGPRVQVSTGDTIYTEQTTFPVYEELFDRADYDYVLRYSAKRNQGGIGDFSATLTDAQSGLVVGAYHHRGYMLTNEMPQFLADFAQAIRSGKVENYVNPRYD